LADRPLFPRCARSCGMPPAPSPRVARDPQRCRARNSAARCRLPRETCARASADRSKRGRAWRRSWCSCSSNLRKSGSPEFWHPGGTFGYISGLRQRRALEEGHTGGPWRRETRGPNPGLERYGRTQVLATQIRQKDGIFYFGSVRAPELLAKVRFISSFYGDGEEIAPARISQDDDIAQFISKIERTAKPFHRPC